jgi:hypothetical protein
MKVIEVRPSKRFKGAWVALEAAGVKQRLLCLLQGKKQSTMRAGASEAAQAKCTSMATTVPPSSAISSSTVAGNIRRSAAIEKHV